MKWYSRKKWRQQWSCIIGGQLTTVQMEVAAISDAQGRVLDLRDAAWKRSMLLELTAIRIGLEKRLGENLIDLASNQVDI